MNQHQWTWTDRIELVIGAIVFLLVALWLCGLISQPTYKPPDPGPGGDQE
jgi:putative copper export protein